MKIGLFIPCFIDAFFPEVGIATLQLLERFDLDVVYPPDQTCCGQPMANSGFETDASGAEALFVRNFDGFDYIVGPSGSCVHHIRHHFAGVEQTAAVSEIRSRTYELVEFLHDIIKVDAFPWARFPHKVGLHNSCGTLRGLRHANASNCESLISPSRNRCCRRLRGLNLWWHRGLTNAVASEACSRSSTRACPQRWAPTRSTTSRRRRLSTSSRRTAPVSCTSAVAPSVKTFPSSSSISRRS